MKVVVGGCVKVLILLSENNFCMIKDKVTIFFYKCLTYFINFYSLLLDFGLEVALIRSLG